MASGNGQWRWRSAAKIAAATTAVVLGLTACGSSSGGDTGGGGASGSSSGGASGDVKVGMAYDVGGRGDKSFNDLAAAGLDKANSDLGVEIKELSAVNGETDAQKADRLTLLASTGYNPVIAVGFAYATALGEVAPKFPDTKFAIVDDSSIDQPNVEGLVFTENESSYLVGVAAASASTTKNIGFIGGVQTPLIQKFQAGYEAGAKSVDPSITVQVQYLSQAPDFSGFNDPAKAKTTADGMYDGGADVVYHAAGGSGSGLFESAASKSKYAIGVDSDQYNSAPDDQKKWILTSALKGVDVAVYSFIEDDSKGTFSAGAKTFSLKDDGVGYSTSNSAIDPFKDAIEKAKAAIVDGTVTVPTTPSS